MNYVSNSESDTRAILQTLKVPDFETLIAGIPSGLRSGELKLPAGISEMELLSQMRKIGQKNRHMDRSVSFLGAGNYEHYIPSAVHAIALRSEFITAYTPYQPEASQGTLQFIYEFQTLMCRLTGMDVANASMYDGASSLAEAGLLALRATERTQIVIAGDVHPESVETLKTYTANIESTLTYVPSVGGQVDLAALEKAVDGRTAVVVFQTPNFLGYLEESERIVGIAHKAGALALVSVNPVSLSAVTPPGDYGADIVVGDGQPLGNPVSYGGPHFGFFAVTNALIRRMPGRLCGLTQDSEGRSAYVLTLQAREQHIRREKATSNICTNHSLCALKATVFLSLLGEEGFKRMGLLNLERSHEAFGMLTKLPSVSAYAKAPFFNEFTIGIKKSPARLKKSFDKNGIIGPLALGRFRKEWEGQYLVAVTEQRSRADIERLAKAIREA